LKTIRDGGHRHQEEKFEWGDAQRQPDVGRAYSAMNVANASSFELVLSLRKAT
jgi:hypothetical protein